MSVKSDVKLLRYCRTFCQKSRQEVHNRLQWVNWVTTFIDRWQLFTLWTCRQLDVELSWVASASLQTLRWRNSTSSERVDNSLTPCVTHKILFESVMQCFFSFWGLCPDPRPPPRAVPPKLGPPRSKNPAPPLLARFWAHITLLYAVLYTHKLCRRKNVY